MFIFAPRDSMSTTRQGSTSRRNNRYARSSTTTSVTQLLSESCTSLLQRLTTKVRGTSTTNDRALRNSNVPSNTGGTRRSPNITRLASARSRLEDKYSSVLDKYSSKRRTEEDRPRGSYSRRHERDHSYRRRDSSPFVREEKTLEPSISRTIVKSPTSVLLSEKAYPYVSSAMRDNKRDKTPGYHRVVDRATLLNSEAYRRYGRHKSGHAETRSRKIRPHRSGKSEQLEGRNNLVGRPVKIEPLTIFDNQKNDKDVDPEKTPTCTSLNGEVKESQENEVDPAISERAAKRKEIQGLIMKYTAMEDAYSQLAAGGTVDLRPSTADIIANKYRKSINQNGGRKDAKNVVVSDASVVNDADAIHDAIVSCRAALLSGVLEDLFERQGVPSSS